MRLFGMMSSISNSSPPMVNARALAARESATSNERGFALLAALMLVLLALTLGAGTLLFTLFDVKATQSFGTGNQAFAVAEAGLSDVINTVNTRGGVVNFQNDVINSGIISTSTVNSISGFSGVSYQVTSLVAGANPANDGIITVTGNAPLSAKRIIKVKVSRGGFLYGAGALHLSNDNATGTFGGNSMIVDGNNWTVTDITTNPPVAALDPSVTSRPAISTRSDTVTTQVITSLSGQGTITGYGPSPSVVTTNSASTADMNRFISDILTANGAPSGCNNTGGGKDYWMPGPCASGPPGTQCGVHCIKQTNGNNNNTADLWGTMAVPNVTYVVDSTAKLTGNSSGAGILIFAGNVSFDGNFSFCGWVLFQTTSGSNITIQGTPEIYGEVLSPLPTATAGGSLIVRYSQSCLKVADAAGITGSSGSIPHPLVITSWSES